MRRQILDNPRICICFAVFLVTVVSTRPMGIKTSLKVSNGEMLTLDKQEEYVLVGASPKYKCTVNQNANFLIGNPLQWEKRGRDGSKVVISVLANVEAGLATEYNVQLDTTDNAMTFTLSFKQGIKEDYDGHFACVLYNKRNTVLAEKTVDVHVIRMIQKTEFEIEGQKQTVVGEPALSIRLEEGTYKPICRTEGSNPAAVIKIYLGNTEKMGDPQVEVPDTSRTQPPPVYNVEKSATISLKPDDNNKILKCVAKVSDYDSMKTEILYKLEVFSIPPEISCINKTAMKGDKFVELTCKFKVPGITCASDNIFWENGENGDRYDVNYNQNGLRVLCLNQVKGLVSTTLIIDAVTEANFETVYFVVYVNKHSTTTRKQAVLNQGYTSWMLVTRPKMFCGYMQLHCFLDDNIPLHRIRQWGRGPDDELLVNNGTSVNSTNYEEELDKTRRISILTVKNLKYEDVNMQYTCQMGFQKDKKWLNITKEDFQCTVNKFEFSMFSIASFVISVVMVVFVTATFVGIAIILSMLPIC